jgi:hypothetical protein
MIAAEKLTGLGRKGMPSWIERLRLSAQGVLSRRRRRRQADALLDELFFSRPEVLDQGRLKPHHRQRVSVLEVIPKERGRITRLVLGIVRHPKAHPLQPRGEDVLEILEYRPAEGRLEVLGSRNLTRRGTDSLA